MKEKIEKRIFIVGYPRSGTTLLQNKVISNSEIYSFPESHFFSRLFLNSNGIKKKLNIPSGKGVHNLKNFMLNVEGVEGFKIPYLAKLNTTLLTNYFVKLLDEVTIKNGKSYWLEKTPRHLHFLEYMSMNIDSHYFIHILRNPIDAISSLFDVTKKYPDEWGGKRSIEECTERWIKDYKISLSYSNHKCHNIVTYNQLVNDETKTISKILNNIGLAFNTYSKINKDIVLDSEKWKKNSLLPTIKVKSKFYTSLEEEERIYVLNRLAFEEDLIKRFFDIDDFIQ